MTHWKLKLNKVWFLGEKEKPTLFLVHVGVGVIPTSVRQDCLHLFFSSFLYPLLSFLLVFYHFAAAREDKMFSENEIRNILFQILSGLAFVHKHGKRLLLSFSLRLALTVFCQVRVKASFVFF